MGNSGAEITIAEYKIGESDEVELQWTVRNRVVLVTDAGIQIIGRNHMIRFIVAHNTIAEIDEAGKVAQEILSAYVRGQRKYFESERAAHPDADGYLPEPVRAWAGSVPRDGTP